MKKHLIFDLNRTIDNFDTYGIKASEKVIKKLFSRVESLYYMAGKLYLAVERYERKYESDDYRENIKKAILDFCLDENIKLEREKLADLVNIFIEEAFSSYKILDDFSEIAGTLTEKYNLYLYTMSTRKEVEENFKTTCLSFEVFKKIYAREDLIEVKPSLLNLEKILSENNLAPKDCIMIGDSPMMDILPAKILGIKTVLFCSYTDSFLKNYYDFLEKIDGLV